jgi:hypothetical protein
MKFSKAIRFIYFSNVKINILRIRFIRDEKLEKYGKYKYFKNGDIKTENFLVE